MLGGGYTPEMSFHRMTFILGTVSLLACGHHSDARTDAGGLDASARDGGGLDGAAVRDGAAVHDGGAPTDGASPGDATPGDGATANDGGPAPTDGGACTRPSIDPSASGRMCEEPLGTPDPTACPTGWACTEDIGFRLGYTCERHCASDCDCPETTTCSDRCDKSGCFLACRL